MDVIREILLALEAAEGSLERLSLPGRDPDEVAYHTMLLVEAGYVTGIDVSSAADTWSRYLMLRPTWQGYEFIEVVRDQGRWDHAKEAMLQRGGGLAVEVLKALLIQMMKQAVL